MENSVLKDFLGGLTPMTEETWQTLRPVIKEKRYHKHQLVSERGREEKKLSILMEGICRAWYSKKDREYTLQFYFGPELTGSPEGFITQTEAKYYVDCLSPAVIYEIDRAELDQLVDEHDEMAAWFKGLSQAILLKLVQRHHNLHALSAEDKMKELITHDPSLLDDLPEDHLASYLGVSIHDLRKIR